MSKEKYKVTITPLTAVHIGTGKDLIPFNYHVNDKEKFDYFDETQIISNLTDQERKTFYDNIDSDKMVDLRKFFRERYKVILYTADASPEFVQKYSKCKNLDINQLKIKEQYKDVNSFCPVIPGSSIKGSIRTAVLDSLLNSNEIFYENNKMQKELLHFNDVKEDPFRAVRITDCEFSQKNLFIGEVVNYKPNKSGGKTAMQLYYEMINWTNSSQFELTIDNKLLDNLNNKLLSMEKILTSTYDFYFDSLEEEFNKYKVLRQEDFADKVNAIDIKKNETLIRIGRHSHFEFVTIKNRKTEVYNKRLREKEFIKEGNTRWLVNYKNNYYPLGWCKLQFEKIT